uniref:Uncharacterized protein n=1 Tax=uncultured bacterium contig00040 TaxID=1181528 RepID=A0A806K0F8_9BACT|nr:hypothetical protein [uncultured bacterium contig00040]
MWNALPTLETVCWGGRPQPPDMLNRAVVVQGAFCRGGRPRPPDMTAFAVAALMFFAINFPMSCPPRKME